MVAEAQVVRERVFRDLALAAQEGARCRSRSSTPGASGCSRPTRSCVARSTRPTNELSTSLSDARLAADAAARRIEEEPEPTLEQLDEEIRTAGLVDLPIVEHDDDHAATSHDDDSPSPLSGEVPAVEMSRPTPPPSRRRRPVRARGSLPYAVDPAPPVDLGERRGRKRRKRESFEGPPAGELTKVEPPAEGEGVRLLDQPEEHAGRRGAGAHARG